MGDKPMLWGFVHDAPLPESLQRLSDTEGLTFVELGPAEIWGLCPSEYPAIVVGSHTDQIELQRAAAGLAGYLDRGGILIWNGAIAHPPLEELAPFEPLAQRSLNSLRVSALCAHPVFVGVPMDSLTFRKGVAGFWGRGHNPPPAGARLINGLGPRPERHPVDWSWSRPGGGMVFMHAGNDLLTFSDDPGINARLASNLIRWVRECAGALQQRQPSETT